MSLQLQRRGGIAHMTGMLSGVATSFLGKTDQQGEVEELLCMGESDWAVSSSASGWQKNKTRADG